MSQKPSDEKVTITAEKTQRIAIPRRARIAQLLAHVSRNAIAVATSIKQKF